MVGPFATFYFESYDTMLHQVQEMLYIEKGGDAQLPDELAAKMTEEEKAEFAAWLDKQREAERESQAS